MEFIINNTMYTINDDGTHCYKWTDAGKGRRTRIKKSEYDQAHDEWVNQQDGTRYVDEDVEEVKRDIPGIGDAEAELMANVNRESPRRANVCNLADGGRGITRDNVETVVTARQVRFIKVLVKTELWQDYGLDGAMWIGFLCDELSGVMNPMSIGAMISTLREKGIITVDKEKVDGKLQKYFEFTSFGKCIVNCIVGEEGGEQL